MRTCTHLFANHRCSAPGRLPASYRAPSLARLLLDPLHCSTLMQTSIPETEGWHVFPVLEVPVADLKCCQCTVPPIVARVRRGRARPRSSAAPELSRGPEKKGPGE